MFEIDRQIIKLVIIILVILITCIILTVKVSTIKEVSKEDKNGRLYSSIGKYMGWASLFFIGCMIMFRKFRPEYFNTFFMLTVLSILISIIFLFMGYSSLRKSDNYNQNVTVSRYILWLGCLNIISLISVVLLLGGPILSKYLAPKN